MDMNYMPHLAKLTLHPGHLISFFSIILMASRPWSNSTCHLELDRDRRTSFASNRKEFKSRLKLMTRWKEMPVGWYTEFFFLVFLRPEKGLSVVSCPEATKPSGNYCPTYKVRWYHRLSQIDTEINLRHDSKIYHTNYFHRCTRNQ